MLSVPWWTIGGVEADLTRLPTGSSGWRALADYALTLGDLSEVDWLELKGTLPFTNRQDRKRSAVVLSRAIIGMANRMPDSAQNHLGGFGVVLVGIDKQAVLGADDVDAAVLRDAVQPYVGEDGPRWDHQFIDHPDGLLLAIIVDPPEWGDRMHACRKSFSAEDGKLAVRDGEVFVRLPGMTQPATSHDLARLEQRRTQAPHTGAEVVVSYDSTFDRVVTEKMQALIAETVDLEAAELLSELPSPQGSAIYGAAFQSIMETSLGARDHRSAAAFRTEVAAWQDEAKQKVGQVATEFFRFTLARGHFMLRNESVRYLEGVRVQVQFPPGVSVLLASDTDYCDHGDRDRPFQVMQLLPERPDKFGSGYALAGLAIPRRDRVIPNLVVPSSFDVEDTPEGHRITWQVGDLPSRGTETGDDLFAVVTDECVDEISAAWSVTARGVHHVFQGEMRLRCEQEEGAHLTWSRGREE